MNKSIDKNKSVQAFTIVELLIVIVIIGILAAITIVSYTGITSRANQSSLQSDLSIAKKQFELYKVDHGEYPTGLDGSNCLTGNISPSPDTKYCLKPSSGASYNLTGGGASDYSLKLTKGEIAYIVTNTTAPTSTVAEIITPTPAYNFIKTWGGAGSEAGYGLIKTTDGGYAMSGYTASFGAGGNDVFLTKYDASGNLTWSKTWGGTGEDINCGGLIQTSDGGYAIAGYTTSFGAGGYDTFIAKYDSSGNLNWSRTWGGTGYDVNYDGLIQTSDGGYATTGRTDSYGAGNPDTFLVKYDSLGNLSWNKTWGGASSDTGYNLIQINDGSYIISGNTNSFGAGNEDTFLAKFNSSGNLTWSKTWGGTGSERSYGLVGTNDGGYATSGLTNSYGAGDYDSFLIKYDSSGNLSWNKTWGGAGAEYGYNLIQTSDNGYATTGYTASYGAGGNDAFLTKFNSSGNLTWSKTWGGTGNDSGYGITQNDDGGYDIFGYTYNFGAGNVDSLFIITNSVGEITNCNTTICKSPTATVTAPSATSTSPSATITSPSATYTSPTASVTSPSATSTTIVAP